MARYGLFVLKVPLNPNQPTNLLIKIILTVLQNVCDMKVYRYRMYEGKVYHAPLRECRRVLISLFQALSP